MRMILEVPQADPYLWPFDGQLTPENTTLLSINFQKIILGDFAKSNLQEHHKFRNLHSSTYCTTVFQFFKK